MKTFAGILEKNRWLLAVLSGALLTVSFPKPALWWAGWFALVPLFAAVKELPAGQAFRLAYAAGLVHFLSMLYWLIFTMRTYGGLPLYLAVPVLFLLAAYMALYIGVFGALVARWTRSSLGLLAVAPLFWVCLEYARGYLLTGFPWSFLGYSQVDRLNIVQISDIFGVYGVSFLLVATNAALFGALEFATKKNAPQARSGAAGGLAVVLLLVAGAWSYGKWRVSHFERILAEAPAKKVTVVQGNIDQAIKWDPENQVATTRKYVELSNSAKGKKPDLVVWPETAVPFYFLYDSDLTKMVLDGIAAMGTDFLIGSPSFKKGNDSVEFYNSAYLVDPEPRLDGKYDKVHLVPFGEYVPLKRWLPFIGKMVAQVGDFKPGKKGDVLSWDNERIGMQICYEIIFPDLSRAMAKNGADILVNITNDAWFAKTSAPYQHFDMAVFRAVENRKSLVRAANTGISGFVDPTGKVPVESGLFEEAVLTRDVPVMKETSLYTRFGDLFAQACAAASLALVLAAVCGRYGKRNINRRSKK